MDKLENLTFRPLKKEEIQVRIGRISERGAELLLYKNARVDQQLLDEAVGPFNWKRSHREVVLANGQVRTACTVSVYDSNKGEWIEKEDFGGNDFMRDVEKASASDAFKRACTNWGIGRALYTAPDIFLTPDMYNATVMKTGDLYCFDEFVVEQLCYDETESYITALSIRNTTKNIRVFCQDNRNEDQKINDKISRVITESEKEEKKTKLMEKAALYNIERPVNLSEPSPTPESKPAVKQAVCDCGGTVIRGKALSELTPQQLLYCYQNTGTPDNKAFAINIAKNDPKYASVFAAAGIAV